MSAKSAKAPQMKKWTQLTTDGEGEINPHTHQQTEVESNVPIAANQDTLKKIAGQNTPIRNPKMVTIAVPMEVILGQNPKRSVLIAI